MKAIDQASHLIWRWSKVTSHTASTVLSEYTKHIISGWNKTTQNVTFYREDPFPHKEMFKLQVNVSDFSQTVQIQFNYFFLNDTMKLKQLTFQSRYIWSDILMLALVLPLLCLSNYKYLMLNYEQNVLSEIKDFCNVTQKNGVIILKMQLCITEINNILKCITTEFFCNSTSQYCCILFK